jgi:hypothetical protein
MITWVVTRPGRDEKGLVIPRDTPRNALMAYLDTHGIAFRASEGVACTASNGYRNEYKIGEDVFVVKSME